MASKIKGKGPTWSQLPHSLRARVRAHLRDVARETMSEAEMIILMDNVGPQSKQADRIRGEAHAFRAAVEKLMSPSD